MKRGTGITITYDADGHRVSKTVNGATTHYLVDDRNPTGYAQVLGEWVNTSEHLTRAYVPGLDLISQRLNTGTGTTPVWEVYYYGYDGLGSVRVLFNAAGTTAQEKYVYDAYGQLTWQQSAGAMKPNNYLFAGEQWDNDLGMYYNRARYYRPDAGRFWTMDSYEGSPSDPMSLHKYLYAHGNPVNGVDPSGHMNLASFQVTVAAWGTMITYMAYRATPAINRATVILFEATTGNTVFLGGAGAAVALRQGTRMGGVGWATWQSIGNLLRGQGSRVGTYKELARALERTGQQANHLNQAAAFPKIPYDEGVAAAIQGGTNLKGSAHHLFHESLEAFWKQFRKNGRRQFDVPTNAEYDEAMRKALEAAGEAAENVDTLAKLAEEARKAFGYFDGHGGLMPEVPNAIPGF